jgi:hypothetical protein
MKDWKQKQQQNKRNRKYQKQSESESLSRRNIIDAFRNLQLNGRYLSITITNIMKKEFFADTIYGLRADLLIRYIDSYSFD